MEKRCAGRSDGLRAVQGFDASRPCAAQLDGALDAEARAFVREIADRVRLSVRAPIQPFAFADVVLRAPDEGTRVRLVRAFIDAHPNGGGGIEALASGYAVACARARTGHVDARSRR